MKNLTCIVCPMGCSLNVDCSASDELSVTGNKCLRGLTYAQEEIRAPKRTVTATVILNQPEGEAGLNISVRRIPVKTTSPCLRVKIPALLKDIYMIQVTVPVKVGDVLISNWNGEGLDVVATRTLDR